MTEPNLVLVPALTDMTRAEVEAHLEAVRSRRMLAALVYHEGRNAKLERQSTTLSRRLLQQNQMLGKEIVALDKALEKVEKRLRGITELENQQTLVQDQIVFLGADDAAQDEVE